MNTYEIIFQRENGTTGADRCTAATEAEARKYFKEVYRHGNYTITSIEMVSDCASATKEQERKALAKIRKIVEGLGEDSYIATAFEGCFEIAESNIENDFACSMKQRAESAEKELESFKRLAESATAEVDKKQEIIDDLKKHEIKADDFFFIEAAIIDKLNSISAKMADAATKIVEYATDTDSDEFRKAVTIHRNAKADYDVYAGVKERVEQAHGIDD